MITQLTFYLLIWSTTYGMEVCAHWFGFSEMVDDILSQLFLVIEILLKFIIHGIDKRLTVHDNLVADHHIVFVCQSCEEEAPFEIRLVERGQNSVETVRLTV